MSDQPKERRGVRGPIVLAVMTVSMIALASTSFVGVWYFENQKAARVVSDKSEVAQQAHDAWVTYCDELGLDEPALAGSANTDFEHARELERQGKNKDANELYDRALDTYFELFADEQARIQDAWRREVVAFWRENLAGRFPFDRNNNKEAMPEAVAALLNPKDGRYWRLARQIDALDEVEFAGRKVASLPDGYRDSLATAKKLRKALFNEGSEVNLSSADPLTLKLCQSFNPSGQN